MVPFSKLFTFATSKDKFLMALGALVAFINGAAMPMFSLIFGEMTDAFGPNSTPDDLLYMAGMNSMYHNFK
jgi:ATP-binding cassette subfamily B (MDR/TAP) protein 1